MDYSSDPPFAEKILAATEFLNSEADILVEDLKDSFYHSLKNKYSYSGFYKGAFESGIEMRMRDSLRRTLTSRLNLTPEEGLVMVGEKPISEMMSIIIERSLQDGSN